MSTNTLKQALEIVYGDIKNISKRVKNLESASIGVLYTETTKSAVAYQDNVSANACPYALLNKVGGMSYKVLDNDTNEYVIRDSAVISVISKDSNNTVLQTINIPNEIQALEGYGVGYDATDYNVLDYETKKYTTKCLHFVLNKTDYNWQLNSSKTVRYVSNFISIIKKVETNTDTPQILCDKLNKTAWDNLYNNLVSSGISISSNGNIGISISDYENLTTLDVVFLLATPIETDISQYLDDNSIQIEPNGTITFENTYQQAIPYEYLYLEKVGANNE